MEKEKYVKYKAPKYVYTKLDQVLGFSFNKDRTIRYMIENEIRFVHWALKNVKSFRLKGEVLKLYESVGHV